MLTERELQEIEEQMGKEYADRIRLMQEELVDKTKVAQDFQDTIKKAMVSKKAKKHLEALVQELKIPLEIPKYPHEEDIEDVKKDLSEIKKQKHKEKIFEMLSSYGLTKEEIPKIAEFQKENGIMDDFAAIRIYAELKRKREELEPTPSVNVFKLPEEFKEEDAYKAVFEELKKEKLLR
jgi:hypothetical protein